MGLILDSSVVIAGERKGLPVEEMLAAVRAITGPTEVALSVVSVMELEHGIWRAKDAATADRRRQFVEDLISSVPVYPLTTGMARRAGRIDAEHQAQGIRIAFQDLLIGVCALELDYAIGTANLRHFRLIPGLSVVEL